ncbi:MAG: hypothetical protein QF902_03350 [Rhodospirillales bacterium]|jgi:hypothetical protein|nr:hypothetical protein [Rhodospirillales bacterium]
MTLRFHDHSQWRSADQAGAANLLTTEKRLQAIRGIETGRQFIERFGEPATRTSRTIAPLAKPRMDNPVLAWRDADSTPDRIASLEIRQYDDARGGFPDLRSGVVLLRWEKAQPIFPLVSALDLMMLK